MPTDPQGGRPAPRPRRNTRPRDALGRPLPYGSEGVPSQPAAVGFDPHAALDEAQRLLDSGMPFHAHEVLEDTWKSAPKEQRLLWQGLAQLAVGMTHAGRGNRSGAIALISRASERLAHFETPPFGIDVSGLRAWAADAVAALSEDERAVLPPIRLRGASAP